MRPYLVRLTLLAAWLVVLSAASLAPGSARATEAPEATDTGLEPLPLVRAPELVEFVQADYPPEALEQQLEETVTLEIEIDEEGNVVDVQVPDPVGHGFDEAAARAARQFRFSPAEDEQGPVPVIIEFEYGFVLDAAEREGAVPEESPEESSTPLPVNLDGMLLEMGTRRPLPDFPVLLPSQEGFQTTTDEEGRFAFRGVPPGTVTLRAAMPGYRPVERELEIREGERTSITLYVRNLSYRDNELVGVYRRKQEEVTRYTLTMEEVKRVPGTFGDPVRVIQSLPGAARSPFGTGALVIRGANPEDTAVYIDGIRVPLIYHLGGIVSVINADLVESVDYLPGGYGVGYGRSLGGVVDVNTRSTYPEQHHAVWSTDLLDSGGLVEGRAGREDRWGYAVAARRSYVDLFIPLFTAGSQYVIEPRWFDYQAKVQRLDLDRGRLDFFLFGFEDVLNVATPDDVAQGTDADAQGDLVSRYSTHRMLANWEHPLGEELELHFTPSFGVDVGEYGLGYDFAGSEEQYLVELRAELPWQPSEAFTLVPGADFIGGTYDFAVEMPFDPFSFADYSPLSEREPWSLEDAGTVLGPDFYLESRLRPLQDPETLLVTAGLRSNYTALEGGFDGWAWEPRGAFRWQLWEQSVFKGSAGLYHQPPMPWEMYRPDGNVQVDYERAWSATVGWEQSVGDALQAEAEVFYKWLDQQLVINWDLQDYSDPYFLNDGVGRVYGAEIIIQRPPVHPLYGWISYTLSRSERNDDPTGDGSWYLFELDQTHILVLVAAWRLPRDFEISIRGQYVTGNPTTPYAGGVYDIDQNFYWPYQTAAYNSQRLPDYSALDLRFEKLFTFRHWQLAAYVDLIHVLHGVNPEFVRYNYDYTESVYVQGLPFIPNPGFDAEFWF